MHDMAPTPDRREFNPDERRDFARAFRLIAAHLPAMFRSFWHRAEEIQWAGSPCFIVYAEDGNPVIRLRRLVSGSYRTDGFTSKGTVLYAVAARSIHEALRAAGLLDPVAPAGASLPGESREESRPAIAPRRKPSSAAAAPMSRYHPAAGG